jgi:hypothetical protein
LLQENLAPEKSLSEKALQKVAPDKLLDSAGWQVGMLLSISSSPQQAKIDCSCSNTDALKEMYTLYIRCAESPETADLSIIFSEAAQAELHLHCPILRLTCGQQIGF